MDRRSAFFVAPDCILLFCRSSRATWVILEVMKRQFAISLTLIVLAAGLTACSAKENTEPGYAAASALGSFCERLPRPAWAAYDQHPASTDWFEVYEIEPGIFAIYEPFQWQEVISWLIVGADSALLYDTGNGIADIRAVVDALTGQPVHVLNSHSHFDHIGSNHQFNQILSLSTSFSVSRAEGFKNEGLALEVSPEALCRPLPDGVSA